MPKEDVNRIHTGEVYQIFTSDNYRDICERLYNLEQVLSQKVNQWNAPTLLRGVIKPDSVEHRESLYIQSSFESTSNDDYDGPSQRMKKTITLIEPFDDKDYIVHVTPKNCTVVNITGEWCAFPIDSTSFSVEIYTSSPPGAGIFTFNYTAIGKKVVQ